MAKTYRFLFNAQSATFDNHFVSVAYGGAKNVLGTDEKVCTLVEALEHLKTFSAGIGAPHAAFVRLARSEARAPAGYKAAQTHIYSEGKGVPS